MRPNKTNTAFVIEPDDWDFIDEALHHLERDPPADSLQAAFVVGALAAFDRHWSEPGAECTLDFRSVKGLARYMIETRTDMPVIDGRPHLTGWGLNGLLRDTQKTGTAELSDSLPS